MICFMHPHVVVVIAVATAIVLFVSYCCCYRIIIGKMKNAWESLTALEVSGSN